ncbi:MAG: hypothetical protein NTZ93_04525 [Candidatus Beckwithbacteria bacterium]|nr:hypothetical protein [Candidatus Beckwithbacteria bacterium]
MNHKKNLSADLMRIGEWLYHGEINLASQFLERDIKLYGNKGLKIGNLPAGSWLNKIKNLSGEKLKAAEKAWTAAAILV